jgi:hypothetical protein
MKPCPVLGFGTVSTVVMQPTTNGAAIGCASLLFVVIGEIGANGTKPRGGKCDC